MGMGEKKMRRRAARGHLSAQHSLLCFEVFFDGFYAVTGIGDSNRVRLAQFVMNQQFSHHSHLEIRFRHVPDLTGF
jgi:hypothetical protein